MRNGKDEADDPHGDFNRIDEMLLKKHDQNDEEISKEIADTLD